MFRGYEGVYKLNSQVAEGGMILKALAGILVPELVRYGGLSDEDKESGSFLCLQESSDRKVCFAGISLVSVGFQRERTTRWAAF